MAELSKKQEKSLRTVALVVYILQALACINGLTMIIGVIISYVKVDDAGGTWLESHYRWQIRTFWYALLWTVLGAITIVILIGYVILLINLIWVIYRIIKGWLRLMEYQAV
jgi:uncharacterized membrane protein